mgnify:CR=1 FL=1
MKCLSTTLDFRPDNYRELSEPYVLWALHLTDLITRLPDEQAIKKRTDERE